MRVADRLRITEIFHSLQGESRPVGLPTVFIRLTGCPLRCVYCDTAYTFHGGEALTIDAIIERASAFRTRVACVTGGEPLAQPGCRVLLARLADLGYDVSLETSGALDIDDIDMRVTIVLDIKTPASGEVARNRWENLALLKPTDQIKFVIAGRDDYEWATQLLTEKSLTDICPVLFSPVWGRGIDASLAEWILADQLSVRFQLQLHKVLWGDEPGR